MSACVCVCPCAPGCGETPGPGGSLSATGLVVKGGSLTIPDHYGTAGLGHPPSRLPGSSCTRPVPCPPPSSRTSSSVLEAECSVSPPPWSVSRHESRVEV